MPIIRSEWPPMYFVAALMAMSTPCSNGLKYRPVAQVLSSMTRAPRARAASAIAGTSWTSKVSEPGDSTKTTARARPDQPLDAGAGQRVVIGRLDAEAGQHAIAELASGCVGGIHHQEMIAGLEEAHQRLDDRGLARAGDHRAIARHRAPRQRPRARRSSACRRGRSRRRAPCGAPRTPRPSRTVWSRPDRLGD